MTNFDFIKLPEVKSLALAAEKATLRDPRSSCIYARITLEAMLISLYGRLACFFTLVPSFDIIAIKKVTIGIARNEPIQGSIYVYFVDNR